MGQQITLNQVFVFLTIINCAVLCVVLDVGKDSYSISVKQEEKDCLTALLL